MIPLLMFVALMAAIFAGFPVAFSLMAVALVFGLLRFGEVAVFQFVSKVDDVANANVLAAVPLFIFMGAMFERSGIADRLFEAIHMWIRRLPGGLAVATVLLCVVFAAASGVIGATESVVGLLSIPIMLRHAYDRGLISGTICAGGSLGTIIPPSVVVIILGPVANVSVGDLFVGMLIPGLLLAGLGGGRWRPRGHAADPAVRPPLPSAPQGDAAPHSAGDGDDPDHPARRLDVRGRVRRFRRDLRDAPSPPH